jgi:hypothetical protein
MVVNGFKGFIGAKNIYITKATLFYYISIFHFQFVFIFCGPVLMFSILIYIFCLILIA